MTKFCSLKFSSNSWTRFLQAFLGWLKVFFYRQNCHREDFGREETMVALEEYVMRLACNCWIFSICSTFFGVLLIVVCYYKRGKWLFMHFLAISGNFELFRQLGSFREELLFIWLFCWKIDENFYYFLKLQLLYNTDKKNYLRKNK